MTPKLYYRASLLFPILLPVLIYLIGAKTWLFGLMIMSLAFGGIAYIIFAIVSYFWIGKLGAAQKIHRFILKTPLLFIPFQAVVWIISFYIQKMSNPNVTGGWEAIPAFAVYILIIGYSYVGLVICGYIICIELGFIKEPETP